MRQGSDGGYLGANRCPASSRRHWPLSIGLSTIAATSLAYSSGRPSRFGNAASLVSAAANSSGNALGQPRGEQARGDRQHPDAQRAEVARHGQAHAGDTGLGGGVGDLPDLALEGRDRRGVDDDAALVVLRLVLGHVGGRQPADVEGGDEVEIDDATGRTPGRAGRSWSSSASRCRRRRWSRTTCRPPSSSTAVCQRLLGAGEVGDVDRVELAADARRRPPCRRSPRGPGSPRWRPAAVSNSALTRDPFPTRRR